MVLLAEIIGVIVLVYLVFLGATRFYTMLDKKDDVK